VENNVGTYYDVLEIPQSASQEEVRAAFRLLIREYHRDALHGIPDHLKRVRRDAENNGHEIQEVWSVLGDPIKRRQYDEALKELREGPSQAASKP
jgi:DnaJ-class molecular chaperone